MTETVGLSKHLDDDERVIHTTSPTQIILMKQDVFEKIRGWEKREHIKSMFRGIIYLTSKRIIFLKLFEVPGASSGQSKNMLVGTSGSFVELPLGGITSVIQRKLNLSKENTFRFVTVFGGDEAQVTDGSALEIAHNERTVHPKKDTTTVSDLIVVLGEPMFSLPTLLSEQIKIHSKPVG